MLILIKVLHTVIWAVFAGLILYLDYSGLTGDITPLTWVAIAAVLLEALVLLWNRWACPLTGIARKYSNSEAENFDIYLPEWLAKHNKTIFTTLFGVGLIATLVRFFWN